MQCIAAKYEATPYAVSVSNHQEAISDATSDILFNVTIPYAVLSFGVQSCQKMGGVANRCAMQPNDA